MHYGEDSLRICENLCEMFFGTIFTHFEVLEDLKEGNSWRVPLAYCMDQIKRTDRCIFEVSSNDKDWW